LLCNHRFCFLDEWRSALDKQRERRAFPNDTFLTAIGSLVRSILPALFRSGAQSQGFSTVAAGPFDPRLLSLPSSSLSGVTTRTLATVACSRNAAEAFLAALFSAS